MTNKYCFCLSGHLGEIVLKDILTNQHQLIEVVLTDNKSASLIQIAREQHIPVFAGNPREGRAAAWLDENDIQFNNIISVNYLFILESDVLYRATNVAVNFHGSLLPKYQGRTPHVWAVINGEKETGITAHLMNSKCDDGDIVKQVVVPIGDNDTGADILEKYNALYPGMVKEILSDIENNRLNHVPQNNEKATYFGKRTPEDGEISWNWQKERIRNWVRAQAYPYPGAFTYLKGKKIIINRIEYSDLGFSDTIKNGFVVAAIDGIPYIKTQNGVVKLTDIETETTIKQGEILSKKVEI